MPLLPPWMPNGWGAGTDNSIVGAGGGFVAYPQPPTPGGFSSAAQPPNTFPEKNGQFGPVSITVNNTIGTFFVISNPGRSA